VGAAAPRPGDPNADEAASLLGSPIPREPGKGPEFLAARRSRLRDHAQLKGPGRPVNEAADRAAVVAALSCVDHVTVFDEDTAVALIEALTPDVYAKGGDHHDELLAEAPAVRRHGGEVRILDYVPDRSTSATIERIREGARARGGRPQGFSRTHSSIQGPEPPCLFGHDR